LAVKSFVNARLVSTEAPYFLNYNSSNDGFETLRTFSQRQTRFS